MDSQLHLQRSINTSTTKRRMGKKNRVMLGSDILKTRQSCRNTYGMSFDSGFPSVETNNVSLQAQEYKVNSIFDATETSRSDQEYNQKTAPVNLQKPMTQAHTRRAIVSPIQESRGLISQPVPGQQASSRYAKNALVGTSRKP